MTPNEKFQEILRLHFATFVGHSYRELNHTTNYLQNWHIHVMSEKLEAVRRGEIKRLIINLPPRHLKSHCASVAFVAWLLGHDPTKRIMCVSYSQELAEKLARDCRTLMNRPFYQQLFPRTRLSNSRQAVYDFETTRGGSRFSTSISGTVTGLGADILIIDDPLKPDEALSEVRRKSVNEAFDNTFYSRLNDKQEGAIIIIMQRLHQDDLVGHVLEQEPWETLSFPAIAERDEEYVFDTHFGSHRFGRKTGAVLHPQRESLATLDRIKRTIGSYNFSAQYQQCPTPKDGLLVDPKWFGRYKPQDLKQPPRQIVQSWDTANKISELHDFSVCTTWWEFEDRYYLIHVYKARLEFPQLMRKVKELANTHSAGTILIEDRASGTQLIQALRADAVTNVHACQPEGDKYMRFRAQTATIEGGFVYLPWHASWLDEYVHEVTTYPGAKHDDQVDSTAQALAYFKAPSAAKAWLAYLKEQSEERQKNSGLIKFPENY